MLQQGSYYGRRDQSGHFLCGWQLWSFYRKMFRDIPERQEVRCLKNLPTKKAGLHGEAQIWYSNGKIKRRGSFQNGKLSGKWEYWDQNGNSAM